MSQDKFPAPRMTAEEVSEALRRLANLLEITGENPFKSAAYRRAAVVIEEMGPALYEHWRAGTLGELPNIGTAIEKKVDEMLRTGGLTALRRLEQEIPRGVEELLRIPGIGPKTARALWQELGITSVEEAVRAAEEGRLREIRGLGARAEQRILAGIRQMRAGPPSASSEDNSAP
ncbi:MAG: helix-hairpin-helix domain-containing protein [Anaerolineae bacterium]